MEHLCRRGRNTDLNILLGTQLQIALEPGRRVFRSLPLHTMRQKHDQATQAVPFLFTRTDELVDDNLGIVGEITELRLPDHQCIRVGRCIAVLKGQYRLF